MSTTNPTKVAIIDDHVLVRHALISMIESSGDFKVVYHCSNGQDFIDDVKRMTRPDVILLDISMPVMSGYDTAQWLYENQPEIAIIILSGHDSEHNQLRLLKYGIRGFVRKDAPPEEIKAAIQTATQTDFYYSNSATSRFVNLLRNPDGGQQELQKKLLSDTEFAFMKLICTELTYKGIAKEMGLNPRSIDTLRDHLFMKMDVQSRIGLAMVSVRNGIVNFFDAQFLRYS
ncbi:MAG: response regulator transcription factor [Chitinophagaceae bacterium]|nr:response regulator transcription factor [Chitinophagaceae bacterium]